MKPDNHELTSASQVAEAEVSYLITLSKEGITFPGFNKLISDIALTMSDWSRILNLSERTFQRYKKAKKSFDKIYSEKIYQVIRVYQRGRNLFNDDAAYELWLETPNTALGRVKPKELLDTSFGIGFLEDEITRIEHGVFA